MAVPANARVLRGVPLKSGVLLGISPSSDPTFDVELARATSSGVYATIGRMTPKGAGIPVSYPDLLPVDNITRYYKARAVKDGWLAGDYTTAVSGKPTVLPEVAPNITPLTGKGIGIDVFLSTGQLVQFGSAAVQQYYSKTIRVTAADCLAQTSTILYAFNGSAELYPNSTDNTARIYFAPVGMPIGATLTAFNARVFRGTTGATVSVNFNQINSTGGIVTTIGKTASGTGYQFLASTTFSLAASTAYAFGLDIRLTSNNAAKTNARFAWCDLTYKVPAVQVGV